MRRNIFGRYFSSLAEGDPVALGVTGLFVVILLAVGLVAWKSKREVGPGRGERSAGA